MRQNRCIQIGQCEGSFIQVAQAAQATSLLAGRRATHFVLHKVVKDSKSIITGCRLSGAEKASNADQYRIGQVVANLLSNADKYSPLERPITLTLRVESITSSEVGEPYEPSQQAKTQQALSMAGRRAYWSRMKGQVSRCRSSHTSGNAFRVPVSRADPAAAGARVSGYTSPRDRYRPWWRHRGRERRWAGIHLLV